MSGPMNLGHTHKEDPGGTNGGGGSSTPLSIVVLKDVKAAGTEGGSGVADTWTDRDLNTKEYDNGGICTLSSNHFTLPAGTYLVFGSIPFFGTRSVKTRIWDVTNSIIRILGGVAFVSDANTSSEHKNLMGVMVLSGTTELALQYLVDNTTGGTTLLGNAFLNDSTTDNVFSQLIIIKVA